jgi:pimeloyl-ACP methyl ester carboxylesterase
MFATVWRRCRGKIICVKKPSPFRIAVPDTTLDRISKRIAEYRWFPAPEAEDWQYGMNTQYLRALCSYWLNGFDWRNQEVVLNRYPQFLVEIDGIDIHYVHVVGEAGGRRPLIMVHGWPGSFYEFWEAVEYLAFPSRFGGDARDAFDLVIPSLPGYAFSGKPRKPFGQRATARLFDTLMREVLGYPSYVAQGGDWGAVVCTHMALNHDACIALHINMVPLKPSGVRAETDEERQWVAKTLKNREDEGGYSIIQSTKPQSLAFAFMDSPVGVAAWIVEKFRTWSDLPAGELECVYSKTQLLTNIMLYVVTDSFATAAWYYRGRVDEGGVGLAQTRIEKPTGIAAGPHVSYMATPPRSLCERLFNVVHWQILKPGGHFLAMEQPQAFAADVRQFGRAVHF